MNRLRRIFGRRRIYGDLSAEIRAHLDEKVEALVAGGMAREDAEHAARREFGNVLLTEERSREAWRWPRLEDSLTDARYGLRNMRRSPVFAVVAILTLALGIGANTAIFSVVNGILLRELPYQRPQSLYAAYETIQIGSRTFPSIAVNAGNFLTWRRECRSFESIALLMPTNRNLDLKSGAVQVHGARASANLFPLLGVQPQLGRNFLPAEDQSGRDREVILTHSFWQAHFQSDPEILGKPILLNGYSFVVVGVLPANFYFPKPDRLYSIPFAGLTAPIQFFIPLGLEPSEMKPGFARHNFAAIARLKPGVSREQALADLNAVDAQIVKRDPNAGTARLRAELVPLKTAVTGQATTGLWILLAGAGVLLLIVCVNLASLLLARSLGRRHEVAVRVALGATRWRLLRQFVVEGLLLASAGGALGLLLAYDGLRALVHSAPLSIPRVGSISVDGRVLLFSAAVSLLAGLLSSVLPALRLSRTSPVEAMRSAALAASGHRGTARLRSALAVSEIAMCSVLLVAALLLAESLGQVLKANVWMDQSHVLTLDLVVPRKTYDSSAKRYQLYDTAIRKIEALPGVRAVGLVSALPLQGEMWTDGLVFQEAPQPEEADTPLANFRFVTPGYFRAMGLPLVKGRYFAPEDEGHPVAIISEGAAKQVLHGRNPIGMHLLWGLPQGKYLQYEVTGIVADARTEADRNAPLTVYLPDWVYSPNRASLVARSQADPRTTAMEMRETVQDLDRQIAVPHEQTMSDLVSEAVAPRRFLTELGTLFALFAAFLAMLGLYGVISLAVAQRTQEIGVRIALGAQPRRILQLVLRQGASMALAGVAIGLAGGLGVAQLLKSLLYGVKPTDPVAFVSVAVLLTVVALLACYVPARRATRVDPVTALRNE
jgi:predicted permease